MPQNSPNSQIPPALLGGAAMGTMAGAPSASPDGITFGEFLQILRRRRTVILQAFVLISVVAVVLTLMTKPVYHASARLLIENPTASYNAIDTSKAFWFRFLVDAKIMEMQQAKRPPS